MSLLDSLRQLYLLLWKNFVLRRRKKLRIVIEILWPLFLFLILMWVRTRQLVVFKGPCHFTERPLPSAGIIPFMRSFVCELNNSCSSIPRQSYTRIELNNLTDLTDNVYKFISDPEVIDSAKTLVEFSDILVKKRNRATEITSAIKLEDSFINQNRTILISSLIYAGLNESFDLNFLEKIFNSNPNFNYLYSNLSQDCEEPFYNTLGGEQVSQVPQSVLDLAYGSDLYQLELNRNTNLVYNANWLRTQTCLPNTNLLLKGTDGQIIADRLCALNDTSLVIFFTTISKGIDFTWVKNQVFDEVYSLDFTFIMQIFKATNAAKKIQTKFQQANIVASNDLNGYNDLYQQILSTNFSSLICSGSQLSIFDIFKNVKISLNKQQIAKIGKNLRDSQQLARAFSDMINFDISALDKFNLKINIPSYYQNPYKDIDRQPDMTKNVSYTNRKTITESTADLLDDENIEDFTFLLNGLNNLRLVSQSDCPIKRPDADRDKATLLLVNSTTKSCFCQNIYSVIFNASGNSGKLFGQLKPMFLGKILYTPNTPAYNKLIKKMNATFEVVDQFGLALKQLSELVEDFRIEMQNPYNQDTASAVILALSQAIGSPIQPINYRSLNKQLAFLRELVLFVHNGISCVELDKFLGFKDEPETVDIGMKLIDKEAFWSAIIFQNQQINNIQLPDIVSYKIRMNSSQVHDTTYTQDRFYRYDAQTCLGCNSYFTYGFIYIQDMLEKSIVEMKTNTTQPFGIIGQMTPYPCYVDDRFVNAIARSLPLFMVLAWIYTVSMMTKDIVYEKEKRLKEFMRVMGLSNATHWAAWFITSFIVMGFIVTILAIVLKFGKITQNSDFSVLLVFLYCFTVATICQCFLISVFFNRANLAAVVAGIVYFILYLPYTILVNYSDVILPWQKFLASLSSTVAFSYGCEIIASFELQTTGAQWSNFYSTPFSKYDGFSMNAICLIMLLDALCYLILTWYIETVFPGEYGVPKPWYFPISPYYWFGENSRLLEKCGLTRNHDKASPTESRNPIFRLYNRVFTKKKRHLIELEEQRQKSAENMRDLVSSIEPIVTDNVPGIQIQNLHKVYSRGNNHALKGLNVCFHQNEITAFLGHNGAGKSTTMHLLTGLYKPTAGTAKIDGLDIGNSMFKIRKSLGFVPQHNVLFPEMTVEEHLWFYARLKGLDRQSTRSEASKLLEDTGLRPKAREFSKDLSGGMQRKLSVAIAFVGGSKTVILDEPSAGVDPSGRRSIWDLLFKYRTGRTIVISTHHMDEADVLGDRIAIISNGMLIAHGTSYFLKNRFGRGYYLTIAKKPLFEDDKNDLTLRNDNLRDNHSVQGRSSADSGLPDYNSVVNLEGIDVIEEGEKGVDGVSSSSGSGSSLDEIEMIQKRKEKMCVEALSSKQDLNLYEFVSSRVESARLVENIGLEMTFTISNKGENTKSYEKFFQELEENLESLGIDSIGISDTTLEEIFIKLAKEPKSNYFKGSVKKVCGLKLPELACLKDKPAKDLNQTEMAEYAALTKMRVESKFSSFLKQLIALLVKRFHRVKRNRKGFFAEIILPVVFVCLALLVATLVPKPTNRPSLELHPWYYQTPNKIFLSKSSSINYETPFFSSDGVFSSSQDMTQQANIKEIDTIVDTFYKASSLGTRCMDGYRIKITPQAEDYRRAMLGSELSCNQFDYKFLQNSSKAISSVVSDLNNKNFSYTKLSPDCDCSKGFPKCPESAGGDINYRRIVELRTADHLYDLTSRNVTDWLIKTEFNDRFFRKRFGGYEFLQLTNQTTIKNLKGISESLFQIFNIFTNLTIDPNQLSQQQNVKIWYNLKGYDSSVSYLNVLNNALLRSKLSADILGKHGIVAFNHPMNFTKVQFFDNLERRVLVDVFVAIFIIFALSFIPASFLVFLLEERENCSKQLQFVSGVKPYIYWVSNFIWDLINYIVPCGLCILLFLIFDVKAYISGQNFWSLSIIMLLYGWACIPLMYPLNYIFKVPSTAFVVSSTMNVFIGIVSVMSTTILDQLGEDDAELKEVNFYLKPIFLVIFPHYCLGRGLLEMSILYNKEQGRLSFGFPPDPKSNPFLFDNVGKNMLALFCQGCVYYTLNMLIEYKFFIRFKPTNDLKKLGLPSLNDQDEDVVAERDRILRKVAAEKIAKKQLKKSKRRLRSSENPAPVSDILNERNAFDQSETGKNESDKDYIRLINLTKIYKKYKPPRLRRKKHVAVNALSLGINKGECFGLIGVNGAGKTTTFKMITGDIGITGGDVEVNGFSVSKQIERVHKSIGYCPQFDALMPLLTAREHLMFFARLRGIPEANVFRVSEWAMNKVGLNVFADRISADFSGGNKRKLSTAIALVGDPSVVCLDEPTSGMDAKARRLLWNDILNLIKENRIVILTSHSMEECEALCTRLVIMVNGQFKCLGSPQHLKTKFGNGYKLGVRLNEESQSDRLLKFMSTSFPSSQINETHRNLFEFILPFSDNKLSKVFGLIEKHRESLNIKDYSVSQSSLDQVFVNFAKEQNEEEFVDMKDAEIKKKKSGRSGKIIRGLKSPVERIRGNIVGGSPTVMKFNKKPETVNMEVFSDVNNNSVVLEVMPNSDRKIVNQNSKDHVNLENRSEHFLW